MTVTTEIYAQPNPSPLIAEANIHGIQNAVASLSLAPIIKVYRIPNPSDLALFSSRKGFYVVTKGEGVGIFKSWCVFLDSIPTYLTIKLQGGMSGEN